MAVLCTQWALLVFRLLPFLFYLCIWFRFVEHRDCLLFKLLLSIYKLNLKIDLKIYHPPPSGRKRGIKLPLLPLISPFAFSSKQALLKESTVVKSCLSAATLPGCGRNVCICMISKLFTYVLSSLIGKWDSLLMWLTFCFFRFESIHSPPRTFQFFRNSLPSYSTCWSTNTNMACSYRDVSKQYRRSCCLGIRAPYFRDMVSSWSTHNINSNCIIVSQCRSRDGIYHWPTVSPRCG